jgi:hypothetical protein
MIYKKLIFLIWSFVYLQQNEMKADDLINFYFLLSGFFNQFYNQIYWNMMSIFLNFYSWYSLAVSPTIVNYYLY